MGRLKIIPFEPAHADMVELRELDRRITAPLGGARAALVYSRAGPAFTGICGGRVVGIAGIALQWPGVGEGWALLADLHGHAYGFHAAILRGISLLQAIHNLHRLQVTAHEEVMTFLQRGRDRRGIVRDNWFERLGFSYEGIMRAYGPDGSDYHRWARVKRWLH